MKPILHLKSISDIAQLIPGWKPKHPLVAIIDFAQVDDYMPEDTRISADFYTLLFKNYCTNRIKYGRQSFDFQDGSLICIAPKQTITMDTDVEKRPDRLGWGFFFHPDLIRGTALGEKIEQYSFFTYEISEALHLSDKEKQMLWDSVQKIQNELDEKIDVHSQTLIVSNIELLLNYCVRYYGRQFITRTSSNSNYVVQVEKLIKSYFRNSDVRNNGLPTVKYLAEQVHLSPNYLSDLLKKETGMNAQDHIHYQLIEEAKRILLNTDQNVSEIAYELGFEYPQYFSKLFKLKTGKTPLEFRSMN
jgi:AraC-like DNA-binding protein